MFDVFDEIEAAAGMELSRGAGRHAESHGLRGRGVPEQDLSNAVQKVNKEVLGSGATAGRSPQPAGAWRGAHWPMVGCALNRQALPGRQRHPWSPWRTGGDRLRVNGDLVELIHGNGSHRPIVTRLKIMGGMDVRKEKAAQDGRVPRYDRGRVKTDLRISPPYNLR